LQQGNGRAKSRDRFADNPAPASLNYRNYRRRNESGEVSIHRHLRLKPTPSRSFSPSGDCPLFPLGPIILQVALDSDYRERLAVAKGQGKKANCL
jgi:hypothetical protein